MKFFPILFNTLLSQANCQVYKRFNVSLSSLKRNKFSIDMKMSDKDNSSNMIDVYVMSKIPHLRETLTKVVPSDIHLMYLPFDVGNDHIDLTKEQISVLKEVKVILCDGQLLCQVIQHLQNLSWAHCTWAGIEPILHSMKTLKIEPKFILTRHSNDAICSLMAEYVVCQILNWERNMTEAWDNQSHCLWNTCQRLSIYRAMSEIKVSILGVGNMGKSVAKYLKNLGTTIKGFSRMPRHPSEFGDFEIITQNIIIALQDCHYIVNTLPHTEFTNNLLTNDKLEVCNMKPVFINVGRGSIITEDALSKAIGNEWITGAILDVFEKEPLSKNSSLWRNPKVIITPHVAAVSNSEQIAQGFLQNYSRYKLNTDLLHTVDWNSGY